MRQLALMAPTWLARHDLDQHEPLWLAPPTNVHPVLVSSAGTDAHVLASTDAYRYTSIVVQREETQSPPGPESKHGIEPLCKRCRRLSANFPSKGHTSAPGSANAQLPCQPLANHLHTTREEGHGRQ